MNGFQVLGNRLLVEEARPKEEEIKIASPRLYIGKIGMNVDFI
jgi:hypothetical protein